MKTKCPDCNNGCDNCSDGYIEVKFAKGDWFTRKCTNCEYENGAWIEWALRDETAPCIKCGCDDLYWVKIGGLNSEISTETENA